MPIIMMIANGHKRGYSPPSSPTTAAHSFCRTHFYKAILIILSCLVVFEFSTMLLSNERNLWMPSFSRYSSQWSVRNLVGLDPRVLSCSPDGCTDQFGNIYDVHNSSSLLRGVVNESEYRVVDNLTQSVVESLTGLEQCPKSPPKLVGLVKVLLEKLSEEEILKSNTELEPGGRFHPKECIARYKVAIILPYRDRDEHLRAFLNNIHPILRRQQLDYGIFVVEQAGGSKFNRGTLMNVGYVEAKKAYEYECFIFHDVDLLPENDRNIYSCPSQPRHMSVAIDKFNYRLPYNTILGGVSAFSDQQFAKINGFPNIYWGWGGEDDDISLRVRSHGFNITRYPTELARYKMIKHGSDPSNPANPIRFDLLKSAAKRFTTDGLSNLKYTVVNAELRPLYTWLLVDIGSPKR